MAIKDDKIVIRVTPGLKRRIESAAKKRDKNTSDFVRDIMVLFLNKEEPEYQVAVEKLHMLLHNKAQLQADIYFLEQDNKEKNTDENTENINKLLMELTRVDQEIYTLERMVNEFLNSKN